MKIYISGAITGTSDAVERFERWEAFLKECGWDVVNPCKICGSIAHWKHEQIMKVCFVLMGECDAVCFMPEWEKSLGANQEYGYALGTDKIILKPSDFDSLADLKCPGVVADKVTVGSG